MQWWVLVPALTTQEFIVPVFHRAFRNTVVAIGLAAAALTAFAQQLPHRLFPPGTQHGTLRLMDFSQASINKIPVKLSPGLRVFTPQNIIVLYSAIANTPVNVAYKMDTQGYVQSVWILSPDEVGAVKSQETGVWPFTSSFFK